MTSSGEPEPSTNAIDKSVGGLVWVRRRNGSWWPGRIMGLEELSESCLVSPRSGTPVKLLGRDDASVDWYNLEKSRRVKAFRCGEYDECIEKAKISAANSNKKTTKYARREDAILHALELESARVGIDHPDFCFRLDNSGGGHETSARESPTTLHSVEESKETKDKESDSVKQLNLGVELSHSGIYFDETNYVSASTAQSIQIKKRKTPNDSEDDGTEGTKRMRGLKDLGMGVASRKKVIVGAVEVVQQEIPTPCDSNTRKCMLNGSSVNGNKDNFSSLRRKRSQTLNVQEFLKRKNRLRPLTKVLESTATISVPVICEQLASVTDSPIDGIPDRKFLGIDSNGSQKNCSVVINNSSNSTQLSCENVVPLNGSENACQISEIDNKIKVNEFSNISALPENSSSNKLFDVPFLGDDKHSAGGTQVGASGNLFSQCSQAEGAPFKNEGHHESESTSSGAVLNNISKSIEQDTSKWQSKGKRKSRNTIKNGKRDLGVCMDMDGEQNADSEGVEHSDGFSQGSDQKVDCDGASGSFPPYRCTLQYKSKLVAEDNVDGFWDWNNHVSSKESHTKVSAAEVKLQNESSLIPHRSLPFRQSRFTVPSRYQKQNFPVRNLCFHAQLYEVNLEVQTNYRPQHVPLVSLRSRLNGKAIIGHPLTVEVLNEGTCDLMTNSSLCDSPKSRGKISSKKLMLQPCFSPSKQSKLRKCEKIRKLSSLTGAHKKSRVDRQPLVQKFSSTPAIACIPLKLVFSRISEAVKGLSRPSHRASTASSSLVEEESSSH